MAVKYDEKQKVDGTVALIVVFVNNAIEDLGHRSCKVWEQKRRQIVNLRTTFFKGFGGFAE